MSNSRVYDEEQVANAFTKLTRELTHAFATERQAFAEDQKSYWLILSMMLTGDEDEAVDAFLKFRSPRGDQWRAKRFLLHGFTNPYFDQRDY